jgi:[acyl-carrier-protein] S-malonyltransferase
MREGGAFFFPGQGVHTLGMATDLVAAFPAAAAVFDAGQEILGIDFRSVCKDGPEEELRSTRLNQPAIFLHSMAVLEAVSSQLPGEHVAFCQGVPAAAVAGLSLGEYSALVFAGCLDFEAALRIVGARGEFMQKACDAEAGAMISVTGLKSEAVEAAVAVARDEGLRVGVANYNSDSQTVVSGARDDVGVVGERLQEAGAKRVIALDVAGAYHSELMAPATAELEPLLREVEIRRPRVPFYSNTAGARVEDPEEIREGLIRQVESSVRWAQILATLIADGLTTGYEVGPGKVIRGLVRNMSRDVKIAPLGTCDDLEKLETTTFAG